MKIVVIGNKGRWAKGHIKTLKNLGVYGGGCDLEMDWYVYLTLKLADKELDGIVVATNAVNHFQIVIWCLAYFNHFSSNWSSVCLVEFT